MQSIKAALRYERIVIAIFFLTWGLIFLDRQALSILTPLMIHEIALSNAQVGQVNMWQTIGYAVSAPVFALISDRLGNKKTILMIGIMATAVLSAVTMAANSFESLLLIRTLLGASEGVILPIAIAMVAAVSSPGKFGRNVGLVYAGAAVIASTIGPVVATQLAELLNWRFAFLFISIPSFIAGILVWVFIKKTTAPAMVDQATSRESMADLLSGLKNRNILVCVVISIFSMAGLWTFASFVPLYLTGVSQLSVSNMGLVMSAFGVFTILWQVFLPYSSDKTGRKPAMIGYAVLAGATPALLFLFPQNVVSIVVYILFGGVIMTLTSLFNSIIPIESVSPKVMATASAVIMGVGEMLGSFAVGISGSLADVYGLPIVMLVAAGAYVVVALVSLALVETRRRQDKTPVEELGVTEAVA